MVLPTQTRIVVIDDVVVIDIVVLVVLVVLVVVVVVIVKVYPIRGKHLPVKCVCQSPTSAVSSSPHCASIKTLDCHLLLLLLSLRGVHKN